MPSFSIGVQIESARIHARFYREAQSVAYANADNVISACRAINVDDAETNKFVQALGKYLDTRRKVIHLFSNDNAQVADRTSFIEKLLPFIRSNNIDQQVAMLQDEKIRHFKGFFTQRLYDLLVARRTVLQQKVVINLSSAYQP